MLLRYLFGFRGDTLINGAVASNATRNTVADIETYLQTLAQGVADIDGDGRADALTDGLLVLRYLFGFRGDTLINGAVSSNATRISAAAIEGQITSSALDTTAPTVTLSFAATSIISGTTFAFTATATEGLTPTVSCSMGTASNNVLMAPIVSTNTSVLCTASATDAANNTGSQTQSILITAAFDLGTDASELGVSQIPNTVNQVFRNNFVRHTSIQAPNGMRIHFYAQDQVSNLQVYRARSIMEFYLTDVPQSTYGTERPL